MSDPCIAALKYVSGQSTKDVLKRFADTLLKQGVNVHGLRQENVQGPDGQRLGVDAIDIHTGDRIPLLRPTPFELNNKQCSLNLAQLSEATGILRRAVQANPDIVLVERFSKAESDGGGLADDLMALMASGIPTVVSVHADEYEAWLSYSGGLADDVDSTVEALNQWWTAARAR